MNKSILRWQNLPLNAFCKRTRRSAIKDIKDVLTISSTQGWVDQKKKWARNMAGRSIEKYVLLRQGEFSYNRGNSKTYPQGCVFRLDDWHEALVPNVYHSFSINAEIVNSDFLQHYFASGALNNQLRTVITSSVRNNGLLNISADEFFKTEVDLPPLPEQKKIAEILSSIDQLINSYKEQRNKQSLLLRDLLQDHFSKKIVKSKLILKDILLNPIQYGANASATKLLHGSPRYLRITDINDEGLLIKSVAVGIDMNKVDYENYLLSNGDVLIARTGNTVGKSYLYKEDNYPLVFAGYLLRISVQSDIYQPEYLFLYTQSDIFKRWVINSSRTGAQPNINAKEYGKMKIPHSSIKEQKSFINSAMSIRKYISLIDQKIRKLGYLKKTISSDLLTGRKRVNI